MILSNRAPTRAKFIIIHGADPKRFADRHGLIPFSHPCGSCGAELSTTLPFAAGTFRGLIAPPCECGNDRPPYCLLLEDFHG